MREAPEPAEQQAAESDEQQALQSSGPSTEAGQRPAEQAPSEYRKFCADYPQLGPEAFLYYCVVKHLQQDPQWTRVSLVFPDGALPPLVGGLVFDSLVRQCSACAVLPARARTRLPIATIVAVLRLTENAYIAMADAHSSVVLYRLSNFPLLPSKQNADIGST